MPFELGTHSEDSMQVVRETDKNGNTKHRIIGNKNTSLNGQYIEDTAFSGDGWQINSDATNADSPNSPSVSAGDAAARAAAEAERERQRLLRQRKGRGI